MPKYQVERSDENARIMAGIGRRVVELREAKGWSQAELATRLGLTNAASVCRIEKGTYKAMHWGVATKYAEVLRTEPIYLVYGLKSDLAFMDEEIKDFVCNAKNYPLIKKLYEDNKKKK